MAWQKRNSSIFALSMPVAGVRVANAKKSTTKYISRYHGAESSLERGTTLVLVSHQSAWVLAIGAICGLRIGWWTTSTMFYRVSFDRVRLHQLLTTRSLLVAFARNLPLQKKDRWGRPWQSSIKTLQDFNEALLHRLHTGRHLGIMKWNFCNSFRSDKRRQKPRAD